MSSSQGLSTSDGPRATSQEGSVLLPGNGRQKEVQEQRPRPRECSSCPCSWQHRPCGDIVAQPEPPFRTQPRKGKHRLPHTSSHPRLAFCCGRRLINTLLNHFAFYRNETKEGSGEGRKQSVSETYLEEEKSLGWVSQDSGTGTLASAR